MGPQKREKNIFYYWRGEGVQGQMKTFFKRLPYYLFQVIYFCYMSKSKNEINDPNLILDVLYERIRCSHETHSHIA